MLACKDSFARLAHQRRNGKEVNPAVAIRRRRRMLRNIGGHELAKAHCAIDGTWQMRWRHLVPNRRVGNEGTGLVI